MVKAFVVADYPVCPQLTALLVLILIPWPGPTVFKISCPRDNARIVRKLVQKVRIRTAL